MKTPRQISFWQDRTQSGGCTAVCTPPFLGPNPAFLRNNPRLLDDNLGLLLHPDRLREIVAEILAARGQLMMYQIRQDLLQLELLHVTVSRIALDGLYEISELGLTNARNAYQMAHLTT